MDETKLYIITARTYTSYDTDECLLKIFERGKIRMVEFKKRTTKTGSNKHVFDLIKSEKWKIFEDTVKRVTKINIDWKIKDIVEQKKIPWVISSKIKSK